ncbi:MAG: hypothetical protein K2H43_05340, partial [Clostridia bacterium]|nr:hypothetical protein [Clostridia bacterium]
MPNFGTGTAGTKAYDGSTFTFKASNYPSTNVTGYSRDPLSVSISNGNGVMSPQPSMTATAAGELEVEMRNAGNYKATFTISDTVNYEWTDGTQTTKDASFTITQYPLTVTSTTTVSGNVWGWAADTSESGTVTVSGFFNGDNTQSADSVNVKLEISDTTGGKSYLTGTDNGDGSYTFTIDQNISIFGGT